MKPQNRILLLLGGDELGLAGEGVVSVPGPWRYAAIGSHQPGSTSTGTHQAGPARTGQHQPGSAATGTL